MVTVLHQASAALYLAATLATAVALALHHARLARISVWCLLAAVLVHTLALVDVHLLERPPSLTALPAATSLMGWLAAGFALLFLRRGRLESLAGLVAPFAFAAAIYAATSLAGGEPADAAATGRWPHLHVILASAGLSLLGVAGVAGVLFLAANRQLKAKRGHALGRPLPSLEALDRVNVVALAAGFPLLTCGVVAGLIWNQGLTGQLWNGGPHATWTGVAWVIYGGLVLARFALGWRGREAAACTAAGFAFLLFAVIGIEAFS